MFEGLNLFSFYALGLRVVKKVVRSHLHQGQLKEGKHLKIFVLI